MELVIISGKGGTGKTTIAATLSEMENQVLKIDCDVDAPNFYLFYSGEDIEKDTFFGGKKAEIDFQVCTKCNKCKDVCKFGAIEDFSVDSLRCEGCGACFLVCPSNAITLQDEKAADTFVTKCDQGIIVRAQMEVGSDGSGKLITNLRKKGEQLNKGQMLTIIDGSPGIGCPVISSITGSDAALIVTEPTKSGLEDLKRVVSLCNHFNVFKMVCINKFDLNKEMTKKIEEYACEHSVGLVGLIPFDEQVMKSVNELKPLTYYQNSKAKKAIEEMWVKIKEFIKNKEEIK